MREARSNLEIWSDTRKGLNPESGLAFDKVVDRFVAPVLVESSSSDDEHEWVDAVASNATFEKWEEELFLAGVQGADVAGDPN